MELQLYVDEQSKNELVAQAVGYLSSADSVKVGGVSFFRGPHGLYIRWDKPELPPVLEGLPVTEAHLYDLFAGTGLPLGHHEQEDEKGVRAWVDQTSAGYGQNLSVSTRIRIYGGKTADQVMALYREIRTGRKPEEEWVTPILPTLFEEQPPEED